MQITDTSKVTLHFSLALDNGDVVDSNFEQSPATFVMGDGSLLPGFEQCLLGLEAGAEQNFVLPPAAAFGEINADSIHDIELRQFKGMDLEPGLVVSFEGAGKRPMPGVVREVKSNTATVDFNHPLAGKNIHFAVAIIEVTTA